MTTLEEGASPAPALTSQKRRGPWSALPHIVTALVVLGVLWWYDVPAWDSLRYFIYLGLVVTLPGAFLWRAFVDGADPSDAAPRRAVVLETVVFGTAVGYALELPAYLIARGAGVPQAFPLLLLVPAIGYSLRKRRIGGRRLGALPQESAHLTTWQAWSILGQVAYLAVWLGVMLFAAHPLAAIRLTDPDEMFHLALVGELRHHFPATYPYVEYPTQLTYQWFVHAHMAASSWATGVEAEMLYRRFDPLVLTSVALLGVGLLAARVSRSVWAAPVAMAVLALVGSFDVTGIVIGSAAPEERFLQAPILMHSPTQTFACVVVLPAAALSLRLVAGHTLGWRGWVILVLSLCAVSGAKVTFLPMLVSAFAAAAVFVAATKRRPDWRSLRAAALTATVIAASTWLLYRGESRSLTWAPMQATEFFMTSLGLQGGGAGGLFLVSAALLVMWLLPGAGALALAPLLRTDPRVWWLTGLVASGYGATMLLGHVGVSQVYFGRSAGMFVAVLSAWGLVHAFGGASRATVMRAIGLAVFAGGVLFCVRLVTEDWRAPAPVDGEMVDSPVLRLWVNLVVVVTGGVMLYAARLLVRDLTGGRRRLSWPLVLAAVVGLGFARTIAFVLGHSPPSEETRPTYVYGEDGRAAAEWLRAHSDPTDRVMTNMHCGPAADEPAEDECDARHFWMSALTQRRFVVEGWAYTGRGDEWTEPFWGSATLLEQNDLALSQPSGERVTSFAERHGVSWMLVDRRGGVDVEALDDLTAVDRRFARGNYVVLRVRD